MKIVILIVSCILLCNIVYSQNNTLISEWDLTMMVYNHEYYELIYNHKVMGSDMKMSFSISFGDVKIDGDTLYFSDRLNKYYLKGINVYDSINYIHTVVLTDTDKLFANNRIIVEWEDKSSRLDINKTFLSLAKYKKKALLRIREKSHTNSNKNIAFGIYKHNIKSLIYTINLKEDYSYEYYLNDIIISSGNWDVYRNVLNLNDKIKGMAYQLIIKKRNIIVPVDLPLFPLLNLNDYQLSLIE